MFDDSFNQWIIIPADDWSALPPVDDEVSGLKDIASIIDTSDQYANEQPARGLLLEEDSSPGLPDSDLFDPIAQFYKTPYSGSSLLPPELSPDSSPASSQASSTPWLRTPQSDTSLASFNTLPPPASVALWDIQEIDEYEPQCVGICLVDESGNRLDEPSTQLSDILQEDVACTPYGLSEFSLLSPVTLTKPIPPPSRSVPSPPSTPLPPSTLTPTSSTFLSPPTPPPPPSQTFLAPPVTSEPHQETPSTPLSTLSIFSPSPSPSPASPHCTPSPIIPHTAPPVSSLYDEEASGVMESTRRSRAVKSRRRMDSLDDEAPLPQIAGRRAKDFDDDEWYPTIERVKRPRVSSESARRVSTSVSPESQASPSQNALRVSPAPDQPDNTPTKCDQCRITFTRASDYLRHIQNSKLHPETSKLWKCPYCDSHLCRRDALTRHIKSNHIGHRVVLPPEGIPRGLGIPDADTLQEIVRSAPKLPRRPLTKRRPKRGGRR